jgi:hypothetical protein
VPLGVNGLTGQFKLKKAAGEIARRTGSDIAWNRPASSSRRRQPGSNEAASIDL